MANVSEKYGLRPVRKLDGSPFINAQNRYRIASNYGTAIFQGDLVIAKNDGTIERHTANNATPVLGVFNGVFYTDPTTQKPTFKNYYPGSIVASDIIANVIACHFCAVRSRTDLFPSWHLHYPQRLRSSGISVGIHLVLSGRTTNSFISAVVGIFFVAEL